MKGWSSLGIVVSIVVIVGVFALSVLRDSSGGLDGSRSVHVVAALLAAATILFGLALTAGVYS